MPAFPWSQKIPLAVALALICAGLTVPVHANGDLQNGFFARKAEGWFWYDDPLEVEDPTPEPEPPLPPAAQVTQAPETPQPALFSTAWLRDSMPKYLDLAIDKPTVENVRAYMYLQRIVMDKAERFAHATQRTVMGDPFLDESVRRPLASFAIKGLDEKAGQATTALVKQIAQTTGIFFFFSSDCQLCEIQAPLIKNLQDHLGFAVVPVSLDGKNLRESPWETFKTDQGQADMLNVQALPATYLVSADGEFELIGQSAYALPELKDRILLAARRQGWISQDELNHTRPISNFTNLAEILGDEIPNKKESGSALQSQSAGLIPPGRLMQYIDSKLELPE